MSDIDKIHIIHEIETFCPNGTSSFWWSKWNIVDCVNMTVAEVTSRLNDTYFTLELEGECNFTMCDDRITGTFDQTSDGSLSIGVLEISSSSVVSSVSMALFVWMLLICLLRQY